ncbi:MAG TPA: glycosyltransferase, partial [Candidatus Sulfotelmatobacter sp.]|nr:glycosyltransferase [Candidatus Sulfotelmatobacter sp.]
MRWHLPHPPAVTVIVPTRHNRPMLTRCLRSLESTDYGHLQLIVVDSGSRSDENERWYGETLSGFDADVQWWERPFNYSAVNNAAAQRARGDLLVFLNDDTEILDSLWLQELVGWAMQPGIGIAGLQLLDAEGRIQHAGAVVGLNGFADHVFEGLGPEEETLLGPVRTVRNVLAVTGACLAVRRELFFELGGFDERFQLCGSDVALGLEAHIRGLRNVCSPFAAVRHLGSATRGEHVPLADYYASYWRYRPWIFGGDPFFSPNLSLESRTPRLRWRDEPPAWKRVETILGRPLGTYRQKDDEEHVVSLARSLRVTRADVQRIDELHRANSDPFPPRSVTWFLPDIDSPFYGGVHTALRIADQLRRHHGVDNRFSIWGRGPEEYVRSALAAAFPLLGDAPIAVHDGTREALSKVPASDVAIATFWVTAYQLAHFAGARRKFYLVQDFEPMFYPAGTMYALSEETYRLGLYGICNTRTLRDLYAGYGGRATSFEPAVDPSVYHAANRREISPDMPVTIFVYARPGHWRNCWEMAAEALLEVKKRFGRRVRIVTAGSWAVDEDLQERMAMTHLGLLDHRATGDLYRHCDIGLALTVSKHPSYLPLELMACGVAVVAFDNPAGHWLLHHEENCLLAEQTVSGLTFALERLVTDVPLRQRLAGSAIRDI